MIIKATMLNKNNEFTVYEEIFVLGFDGDKAIALRRKEADENTPRRTILEKVALSDIYITDPAYTPRGVWADDSTQGIIG